MEASKVHPPRNEPGLVLGISLISILVALLVASFAAGMSSNRGEIVIGIYLTAWGLMFLASYYFSHKTFFLRGLMWVCENFTVPPGRRMAFFYFALGTALGISSVARGLLDL